MFQRETNPGPVQFGERPSWTQHGSARPFAELDPRRIQLGRLPSWINRNPSLPRPRNSSSDVASNSFLFRLDQRHLGTLRFRNRGNTSFLEGHSDWSYKTATVNKTPRIAYVIRGIGMFLKFDVVSKALFV
ncbi:hypothetical protein F2Q70_00004376 [Brassica cretica]|uniref:Uncharacterized protein n=1 Tax=Brassica cretica TaxID=69181 RepID=A0A8S9IR19_BRACR|nr:hypothetical protein F2Q70_00004376 [Brassica cretica]